MRTCPGSSASPWIIKRVLGMVPIQKKGRSKRGHKDKVLDMALGSAPKSAGKKPSNRKKSNSQKPPVTETRDLLEGNRSVFVNPQAPVFPLNVAPVPILPAIQQQTENNRLNSLFPEAAPHQPVIQNVSPVPPFPRSPITRSPIPRSPIPRSPITRSLITRSPVLPFPHSPFPHSPFPHYPFPHYPFPHYPFRVLKIAGFSLFHVFRQRRRSFCLYSIYYSYFTRILLVCTRMYFCFTRMLLVCTRVLLVCTRMLLVCYSYVTRMYSYVLVCYSYVTRMYWCGVIVTIPVNRATNQ